MELIEFVKDTGFGGNCQRRFDIFDELLDHLVALFLGKSEFLVYVLNDVCLGQGHYLYPSRVRWLKLIEFVKDTGFGGNCQRI